MNRDGKSGNTVVRAEYTAPDGRKLRLCDFGSAGEGGSPYRSWLPAEEIDPDKSGHRITHCEAGDPNSDRTLSQNP